MKSWAATSRLVAPSLTSRTICSSWGLSWSRVLGSRLRAVSPVARSSVRARFERADRIDPGAVRAEQLLAAVGPPRPHGGLELIGHRADRVQHTAGGGTRSPQRLEVVERLLRPAGGQRKPPERTVGVAGRLDQTTRYGLAQRLLGERPSLLLASAQAD